MALLGFLTQSRLSPGNYCVRGFGQTADGKRGIESRDWPPEFAKALEQIKRHAEVRGIGPRLQAG